MNNKALTLFVKGTVQGVGFRPFVYRLAKEMGLNGFVKNTPRGVEIYLEGNGHLSDFAERLRNEAPPNSRIGGIETLYSEAKGYSDFMIYTTSEGEATVFAPPDLFTCKECVQELFNPSDRRFRYPFINCTNCGPRYTIINALPYDREKTTMKIFKMCPQCESEYNNPLNRRFHAEPNACPACGPKVFFIEKDKKIDGGIEKAINKIKEGKIVAVKGIGGFHLICDAYSKEAVDRLRILKERDRKPFALMAKDLEKVKEIAFLNDDETNILISVPRPIALLKKKVEIPDISPGINSYGIMLPYTPLHALIMKEIPLVVATSANLRESPILKEEKEGVDKISDCILTHNREIAVRCDDSVLKIVDGNPVFLRRSRGYVPEPVDLKFKCEQNILSLGGELKNTISIIKDGYLITSQYLGDMKDLRNKRYLEEVISLFCNLYSFNPDVVSCDLHPNFTTTRMAEKKGKPLIKVQHHVSHIFAVLAEYGILPEEPFLAVAFDGAGYGEDGCIWGGEFFVGGSGKIKREFHLKYIPQQGGDLATKEPWRMALSYILDAIGKPELTGILEVVDEKKIKGAQNAIRKKINCPMTSSMGRLFDSVSAIAGISPLKTDYEAEAAMRLESIAGEDIDGTYPFRMSGQEIDMSKTIRAILDSKESPAVISKKFHNTIAQVILNISQTCKEKYGTKRVILSGGVFLNSILLKKAVCSLKQLGMEVYVPKKFSPGDEGISVGQAYYTALKLKGVI